MLQELCKLLMNYFYVEIKLIIKQIESESSNRFNSKFQSILAKFFKKLKVQFNG